MIGKLRNMTAIYLIKGEKVVLLFRQGGQVVNNVWTGSAGGHFEEFELNNAKACVSLLRWKSNNWWNGRH